MIGSMTYAQFAQNVLWAGIAALGFAVLFNVPRRALIGCALGGAIAWAVRTLLDLQGPLSMEAATLAAATTVAVLGLLMGRHWHLPAPVFVMAGVIPLVPGALAFRTMIDILHVATSEGVADQAVLTTAIVNGIKTALIVAAIAGGVAIPSLLIRRYQPMT